MPSGRVTLPPQERAEQRLSPVPFADPLLGLGRQFSHGGQTPSGLPISHSWPKGLPEPYASRVASQRRILAALSTEITLVEVETANRLKDNREYRSLLTIAGIGPVLASIFVAEIGDVHRFTSADQLACRAGLTTRVDSSDAKTRSGHVSKQGSRLLRWAAVEGCQRAQEPYLAQRRRAIVARRGKSAQHIATVAAARHLIRVVFYTMRDGHARCLDGPPAATVPALR